MSAENSDHFEIRLPKSDRRISVLVKRSAKRSRMGLQMLGGDVLLGRLPLRTPLQRLKLFIEENEQWILEACEKNAERIRLMGGPPLALREGGYILYRGVHAGLRFDTKYSRVVRMGAGHEFEIWLKSSSDDRAACKAELIKILKADARRVIDVFYGVICARAKRLPQRWRLKSTKSRWGSCSSKGNLNFSWHLIFLPDDLIYGTIAHEFAHLIELNHSDAFWREVAYLDPKWREVRERMRCYVYTLLPFTSEESGKADDEEG